MRVENHLPPRLKIYKPVKHSQPDYVNSVIELLKVHTYAINNINILCEYTHTHARARAHTHTHTRTTFCEKS